MIKQLPLPVSATLRLAHLAFGFQVVFGLCPRAALLRSRFRDRLDRASRSHHSIDLDDLCRSRYFSSEQRLLGSLEQIKGFGAIDLVKEEGTGPRELVQCPLHPMKLPEVAALPSRVKVCQRTKSLPR